MRPLALDAFRMAQDVVTGQGFHLVPYQRLPDGDVSVLPTHLFLFEWLSYRDSRMPGIEISQTAHQE